MPSFNAATGTRRELSIFFSPSALDKGCGIAARLKRLSKASQFGAAVIVDDPWGRDLAARDDLDFHATIWVLQRFHELELISSTALRDGLASLRRRGTRLPWDTVSALLVEIGEQPL